MTESMKYYEAIRREYPETISKDQFYRIAHISKATALHLLQSGLVPCRDSGKKTRRYTIRTDDVIYYMIDRELHPEVYRAPDLWYQGRSGHYTSQITYRNEMLNLSDDERAAFRKYVEHEFHEYGDLLTVVEVTEAIGYCDTSLHRWCNAKKLKAFNISGRFLIPKISLVDFLVSQYSFDIIRKTWKHTLGDRKTALFVIISDTDDTFNFVVAIMYSQMFNLLCDKADDVYNGRLPVHVRCLLDEFANIGQIPKFDKLIATIRSREISASIILQSQSQLKTIYKDAADTIVGNCDVTLFLGGKEKSTLKEISEVLGKETIDLYNTSETRSTNNSYGLNYQKVGKELMSQDEIAVMDGGKCILQLRGVRPFLSDKFDITKHPKYKLLSDFDKRNAFDIEKYRSRKLVVKPTDKFDLYDMGEVEAG